MFHDNFVQIDLFDDRVEITFSASGSFGGGSFNGYSFTDFTDTIDPFISVTVSAANTLAGFNKFSFNADSIFVEGESLSFVPGTVMAFDVGVVPEPSTLLLLASGLAGLAAWRRKSAA